MTFSDYMLRSVDGEPWKLVDPATYQDTLNSRYSGKVSEWKYSDALGRDYAATLKYKNKDAGISYATRFIPFVDATETQLRQAFINYYAPAAVSNGTLDQLNDEIFPLYVEVTAAGDALAIYDRISGALLAPVNENTLRDALLEIEATHEWRTGLWRHVITYPDDPERNDFIVDEDTYWKVLENRERGDKYHRTTKKGYGAYVYKITNRTHNVIHELRPLELTEGWRTFLQTYPIKNSFLAIKEGK